MHPSMRVHYLKSSDWEPEWIETAVELAEETWHAHYMPKHLELETPVVESSSDATSFGFNVSATQVVNTCC
jgi:hypothetical protein